MGKIKAYVQSTKDELLTKVSWPTWKELQESAIIVMIASLLIAAVVYAMDSAFSFLLKMVYQFFN